MRKASILSFLFMIFLAVALFWWWSSLLPKSINTSNNSNVEEPYLAYVYSISGEAVSRKSRIGIVNPLIEGERLTSETSIRTFEKSHIVIMIGESQDRIEIGPETEVVFFLKDKTFFVSLLYGEVYGSFHGEKKSYNYELSTARIKAATENADFVFRSNEKGFQKIELYRGTVVAQTGAKTVELGKDQYVTSNKSGELKLAKQDILIITPLSHDRVYHSNEGEVESRTRFAWAGLKDLKKVEVLLGDSQENLAPIALNESAKADEVTAALPEGIHYWRLKATLGDKKHAKVILGPLYKIFVVTESPVQLIEPMGAYSQKTKSRLGGVFFRWANPSKLERLFLEVSADKNFGSTILRQPVSDEANNIITSFDEGGVLYWRVSGFRHDSSELVTSNIGKFEIADAESSEPEIIVPIVNQVFTTKSLKANNTFFRWKAAGLTVYEVEITDSQNKSVFKTEVVGSQILAPFLPAGHYKLLVQPKGATGSSREFEIVDAKDLRWKVEPTQSNAIKTLSKLAWEPGDRSASVYRIQVSSFFPVRESLVLKEYVASSSELTLDLAEEGLYSATVQALDTNSKVISESEPLIFRWNP